MKKREKRKCSECGKERERCRIASIKVIDGIDEVEWVCRKCWDEFEYDRFMYLHKEDLR